MPLYIVGIMFRPFRRLEEVFREKGATTPETALTWKELGLPDELEHMRPPLLSDMSPIVKTGQRYYLSEERLKEFRKEFEPLRKWIKHTAKVPKGFLRFRVLQKLKEGPMSGSELTAAIEEEMGGRWKPKPGSMYPLLKSLLQDGLTQEVPVEDGRTRKYELTSAGQRFLKTQIDKSGELRDKIGLGFIPPLFPLFPDIPPYVRNLFRTLPSLTIILQNNPPPKTAKQLEKAVNRFINELEEIQKSLDSSE
ncbi:MAG: PadR family transcriptional regulator [Candidatus Thorarchaeota archaeon]